tara:strand:+ start:3169 stop:3627 length:459 start_codon:yes stop_codon:yes gene_type:complete
MQGYKHIVECHCILPQFRNIKNPPWHKFVVFSVIDEGDTVVPKHAQCNNCGVVHNVFDIGKSEILAGQELGAVIQKEDIALMLPSSLKNMLISYGCDVATWENVLFVLQNSKFPCNIILDKKEENGLISGKLLEMADHGKYVIKPYSSRVEI